MSDTEVYLLAAVLAAPEDNAPRLALADWWEENANDLCRSCAGSGYRGPTAADLLPVLERVGPDGRIERFVELPPLDYKPPPQCPVCSGSGRVSDGRKERAEFVRVQCELARLDGGTRCPVCDWPYMMGEGCEPGNCSFRPGERSAEYASWKERQTAYHALRERERELWNANWKQWFGTLGGVPGGWLGGKSTQLVSRELLLVVRRGFIEHVTCDLATLFGGQCVRCQETGCLYCGGPDFDYHTACCKCPACHGTGTTPGIAADLFASQPVTTVALTDWEPDMLSREAVALGRELAAAKRKAVTA